MINEHFTGLIVPDDNLPYDTIHVSRNMYPWLVRVIEEYFLRLLKIEKQDKLEELVDAEVKLTAFCETEEGGVNIITTAQEQAFHDQLEAGHA